MDVYMIITLLGGLALFLYGMNLMSQGLERLAGGKLEAILRAMTSNRYKALFLGLGVTALIQSSSAVTVMLVGLVNSGIMTLRQTVGVIMGTNIGTTVTAWIFSLVGIEGDNVWVNLIKPENFSPILALIGVLLMMAAKSNKKKDAGVVMIGFAILMYGMEFMAGAMDPLKDMPEFTRFLTTFNNPFLGLLAGIIFTAIIQSSSASVGILQAVALTGGLSYGMVMPIIMGQNIGTCITSVISSIGTSKNAKRVAAIHVVFNVLGTCLFMALYFLARYGVGLAIFDQMISPVHIAILHSLFNIFSTVIFFPFADSFVRISQRIVRDEEGAETVVFLDERLLNTPSVAVEEARSKTNEMLGLAFANYRDAIDLSNYYSEALFEKIRRTEQELDYYEDQLGSFNVKLAQSELSDEDSARVSMMLHMITDAERVGDHSFNIAESVRELHSKGSQFSEEARRELTVLCRAVEEILRWTKTAILENDVEAARRVEPLEEVVDDLVEHIRQNHIARLKSGHCTIELGFILNDILGNVERVSDHCSNIAAAEIELQQHHLNMHEYVHSLKTERDAEFRRLYEQYTEQYYLT